MGRHHDVQVAIALAWKSARGKLGVDAEIHESTVDPFGNLGHIHIAQGAVPDGAGLCQLPANAL